MYYVQYLPVGRSLKLKCIESRFVSNITNSICSNKKIANVQLIQLLKCFDQLFHHTFKATTISQPASASLDFSNWINKAPIIMNPKVTPSVQHIFHCFIQFPIHRKRLFMVQVLETSQTNEIKLFLIDKLERCVPRENNSSLLVGFWVDAMRCIDRCN